MLGNWNFAVYLLKRFEMNLAIKLIERLEARQAALMTPPVLAGAYLDPEFQGLPQTPNKK